MFKEGIAICSILLVFSITLTPAFSLDELQRADIADPRLENAFGKPITDNVNVNQQIQISADIINKQEKPQSFVYFVQIKEKSGVVVSLGWISGPLASFQKLSPSLSWTPEKEGEYTAEIFVWEDFKNYNALAKNIQVQINVS